jgi:hypothetical protein
MPQDRNHVPSDRIGPEQLEQHPVLHEKRRPPVVGATPVVSRAGKNVAPNQLERRRGSQPPVGDDLLAVVPHETVVERRSRSHDDEHDQGERRRDFSSTLSSNLLRLPLLLWGSPPPQLVLGPVLLVTRGRPASMGLTLHVI